MTEYPSPFDLCPIGVLRIEDDGWLVPGRGIELAPSPHFDARSAEGAADLHTVVIHNISLPPLTFGSGTVREFFCGTLDCCRHPHLQSLKGVRVSSHFFIDRKGVLTQFVSCLERAWHAGVSCFNGRECCNDFTIGIEVEGTDFVPFADVQYATLERLLAAIDVRFALHYVVGHSDIAPGRKTDPGPYFDWLRLERASEVFGRPRFVGAAACMQKARMEQHRNLC